MTRCAALLVLCALAGAAPLLRPPVAAPREAFPGWPGELDGRRLRAEPLSPREARFAASFPGRLGAFDDGRRRVLVRWIVRPSRQLHPAADCLRGAGYAVAPLPLAVDAQGRAWGVLAASLDGRRFTVRERIVDRAGGEFTDASAWYWAALLGRSEGPWWAWTVFESD